MASCSYKLVLSALLLFCVFESGTCLKCYACNSLTNVICADPVKNGTTLPSVDCNENNYGCMKQILYAAGGVDRSIHRGCTPAIYCTLLGSVSEHCSVCTHEYCNSSSIVMPSFAIIAGIWFILKYVIN